MKVVLVDSDSGVVVEVTLQAALYEVTDMCVISHSTNR